MWTDIVYVLPIFICEVCDLCVEKTGVYVGVWECGGSLLFFRFGDFFEGFEG